MSERVVPPAARQRRRPTKQGVVLSEELIVETALRLIEEHGADALSVRRLGRALGADPSSLYRYFRHTDDLMLAIADELIGPPARWQARAALGQVAQSLGDDAAAATAYDQAGALIESFAATLAPERATRLLAAPAVDEILSLAGRGSTA